MRGVAAPPDTQGLIQSYLPPWVSGDLLRNSKDWVLFNEAFLVTRALLATSAEDLWRAIFRVFKLGEVELQPLCEVANI
jgi:hypothetical protein